MLRHPGYLKGLVFCALLGIPVSLIAFWFLAGIHQLEHIIWVSWPHDLGHHDAPWWWALPMAMVPAVGTTLVVLYLPGRGGHVPAGGLHAGGASASWIPGVVLAAACCLPWGVVLGPEAPLIALGGGLALLFRNLLRLPSTPASTMLLAAAGSASAISAIFGNPLVGGILLMEVSGVGGTQLLALMLPALLASGVGSIVFTGFGRWTGLQTGSLTLDLPKPPRLDTGDVVWSVLMAAAIGVAVHYILALGRHVAVRVAPRPLPMIAVFTAGMALCITLYALATGRSPADAALSGQNALAQLAKDPHAWPVGALVAVLAFKGLAYAFSLGSLRGGPIFPSLFLGGAAGVLLAPLPGFGVVPAMAAGMAAAASAALRLPVSSVVLVTLLVGHAEALPVIILGAVVALIVAELLPPGPPVPPFPGE
ncbi:chloride channel protein [Actinacidiphila acidipaludis]|uniref:Chloride channel protein n=1 Tax=Actinacidiphila acidipaludis TaxID=2873382 RepID=A0ABS7Q7Y0_9ACTN|nr:chloride channel protein [Streptomyces acidipaludis]MBY8878941.1 chloride channel protein [Streptomyces acidipaludis]